MKILATAILAAGLAATALTGTPALAATADSAAPAADTLITATYPVSGSAYLKRLNSSLSLGPGSLVSTLDLNTGGVTGSLNLPPASGSFKELNLVPVSVTTELVPVGQLTGTASLGDNTVSTTSTAYLKIDSLKVAGLNIPVGGSCETASPVSITVSSAAGFTLLGGGDVTGTFSIGKFAHCGLIATPLLNLTIPGSGNTITLTLGAPTLS